MNKIILSVEGVILNDVIEQLITKSRLGWNAVHTASNTFTEKAAKYEYFNFYFMKQEV
jgi:hypothetical protein